MLARIQEFTPKPLAVSDPAVKQPAPTEEFSVSLDQATLTLLLNEMNKLGIDTSKLKISSDPTQPAPVNSGNPQPAGAGPTTAPSPAKQLTPFDPQPAPVVTTATAADAAAVSEAQFVPE